MPNCLPFRARRILSIAASSRHNKLDMQRPRGEVGMRPVSTLSIDIWERFTMQRLVIGTCGGVLLVFSLARAQEGKLAVPPQAALSKAEALIQELYKDDFTKAKGDN